ncbi:actin-like ATPase domain-containing protein [Rhizodiscina lignyota]|uniref:Phosphotransferase n=1 Tax=Rhizodiscina lignyota TaxID=1504668 RepID=A0A9P4IBU8_9PEZI|nr:actin-like ATPase domain-containing protein [Rhizodiscina lignyota]
MLPSVAKTILPSIPSAKKLYNVVITSDRTMDEFLAEVKRTFEAPLQLSALLDISAKLKAQYKQRLLESDAPCMLPSYNHTLPTGEERGTYLALDVGGSTFRVALVELKGKDLGEKGMEIVKMVSYKIDNSITALKGRLFFDWMAEKIEQTLAEPEVQSHRGSKVLPMGLAWSFPVEQTSPRSGKLKRMGKGFGADHGCVDIDLCELIMDSCRKRNLQVTLDAIVNDGTATLLSRAYRDPATRLALILGTGTNAAIHLPVTALSQEKFGQRPQSWHDEATHVLVNTEMSMFGKGIHKVSKWDDDLNEHHQKKDYQPFEHLISGRYLGEIVRLIVVEAVADAGLFEGRLPDGMDIPYNFYTDLMAQLEADETPSLSKSMYALQKAHPLPASHPYTRTDVVYLRQICQLVSQRAAAYLASGVHALWSLRLDEEGLSPDAEDHVTIGCNGSVIEKYPGFRERAQAYLDELCVRSGGRRGGIVLEIAIESAIYGAAVAVCALEGQDAGVDGKVG